jgi:hypothetical protein
MSPPRRLHERFFGDLPEYPPYFHLRIDGGSGGGGERDGCFANLHTYIGYKVPEFSDQTLTGVIIRRSEK